MFQFRRFASYTYVFSIWYMNMTSCGFPHSDICGSMLVYSSPQLFAVNHVLLRLSVPRHPPCALFSLTLLWLCFSRLDCNLVFLRLPIKTLKPFLVFLVFIAVYFSCFCFRCSVFKVLLFVRALNPWWAQVDSNHRPHAYQACALTTWAMRPFSQYLGCSLSFLMSCGGDEEDRTPDPLLAKQVLSQLSYTPISPLKAWTFKIKQRASKFPYWPWMLNRFSSLLDSP